MIKALKKLALFLQENGILAEAQQIDHIMKKYADNNVNYIDNIDDQYKDQLVSDAMDQYMNKLTQMAEDDVVGVGPNGDMISAGDLIKEIFKDTES